MDVTFEKEISAQQAVRDRQAKIYVDYYMTRGPTFVTINEALLFRKAKFEAHHRVLDAGAGVGYFSVKIAPQVKHLDAVDFSHESLRILKDEARARGLVNVDVQFADLTKPLPFGSQSFDRLLSYQVLSYLPRSTMPVAFHEFHRVLKPGGTALMTFLKHGWRGDFRSQNFDEVEGFRRYGYTPQELKSLLAAIGFSKVEVFGYQNAPARLYAWADRHPWARPFVIAADYLAGFLPFSTSLGRMLMVRVTR